MRSPNSATRRLSPENIAGILVSEGEVTEDRMQAALAEQREGHRSLGEILVSDGYLAAADLARILSRHLNMKYVVLSQEEVDPALISMVEEETLVQCGAIPLRLEDGKLVVAMSDPTNAEARSCVVESAGRPVVTVAAAEDAIRATRERLLDAKKDENQTADDSQDNKREFEGTAADTGPPVPNPDAAAEETEVYEPNEEPGLDTVDTEEAGPAEQRPQRRGTLTGSGGLADLLISEGKVSPEQLQEVLVIQQTDSRQVGEIMVSLGYVNDMDIAQATARRLKLDCVELTESHVDLDLMSLVDRNVLRRHGAVPLRIENGRLAVAMSNPRDIPALEDLRMISGYPITPVVATGPDIQKVQKKLFARGEDVSDLLEEATGDSTANTEGELDLGVDARPDEAPIIRLVGSILKQAASERASDVHIEPQAHEVMVRFRVDGVLREVMSVPSKLQGGVVARLKVVASLDIAERRIPQDGRFSVRVGGGKVDLRMATLPTAHGEKVVLRLLDASHVEANLGKLGFSASAFEKYKEVFTRPYGAILVTGPTGSGKSTTLYATLNELNSPQRNIITVEDPVEHRIPGLNQMQVNPRAGLTFASGLRSILRSDPDVIMIGEIRDLETAKISVESALTGHLVFATLHTTNAPSALTRLTEMGVEPFLTSSAVDCVIAQRLGRRLCEECKKRIEVRSDVLRDMNFPFHLVGDEEMQFYKPGGCTHCSGTGYRGRIGFYEMMLVDDALKDMVLHKVSTNEISCAAEEAGMVRLREDGMVKASQGTTTVEEVLRTVV